MAESTLNSVIEIFLTETQRGILGGAKVDMQINSLDMLEKDILLHRTKLTQRDVCCLLTGDGKRRGLIYMCGQTSRKTKKMANRADKHLTKTANRALRLLCKLAFFRGAHLRVGRGTDDAATSDGVDAAAAGGAPAAASGMSGGGDDDLDDLDDDVDDDIDDEEDDDEAYYTALTSEARNIFLLELFSLKVRLLRKAKLDLHIIHNSHAARSALSRASEVGNEAEGDGDGEAAAPASPLAAASSPSSLMKRRGTNHSSIYGGTFASLEEQGASLEVYTAALRLAHVLCSHSGGPKFSTEVVLACEKEDLRAAVEYRWWRKREEVERLRRGEEREALRREEQLAVHISPEVWSGALLIDPDRVDNVEDKRKSAAAIKREVWKLERQFAVDPFGCIAKIDVNEMMQNKGAALTSSAFEPRALLEALHRETKLEALKDGQTHLKNRQPAILEQQRELVCMHFDRFLEGVGAVNTAAEAAAAVAADRSPDRHGSKAGGTLTTAQQRIVNRSGLRSPSPNGGGDDDELAAGMRTLARKATSGAHTLEATAQQAADRLSVLMHQKRRRLEIAGVLARFEQQRGLKHGGLLALIGVHDRITIHVKQQAYGLLADSYSQANAMADVFGRDVVQQVMRRIERCVGQSRVELQLQLGQLCGEAIELLQTVVRSLAHSGETTLSGGEMRRNALVRQDADALAVAAAVATLQGMGIGARVEKEIQRTVGYIEGLRKEDPAPAVVAEGGDKDDALAKGKPDRSTAKDDPLAKFITARVDGAHALLVRGSASRRIERLSAHTYIAVATLVGINVVLQLDDGEDAPLAYRCTPELLEIAGDQVARLVARLAALAEGDIGAHLALDILLRKVRALSASIALLDEACRPYLARLPTTQVFADVETGHGSKGGGASPATARRDSAASPTFTTTPPSFVTAPPPAPRQSRPSTMWSKAKNLMLAGEEGGGDSAPETPPSARDLSPSRSGSGRPRRGSTFGSGASRGSALSSGGPSGRRSSTSGLRIEFISPDDHSSNARSLVASASPKMVSSRRTSVKRLSLSASLQSQSGEGGEGGAKSPSSKPKSRRATIRRKSSIAMQEIPKSSDEKGGSAAQGVSPTPRTSAKGWQRARTALRRKSSIGGTMSISTGSGGVSPRPTSPVTRDLPQKRPLARAKLVNALSALRGLQHRALQLYIEGRFTAAAAEIRAIELTPSAERGVAAGIDFRCVVARSRGERELLPLARSVRAAARRCIAETKTALAWHWNATRWKLPAVTDGAAAAEAAGAAGSSSSRAPVPASSAPLRTATVLCCRMMATLTGATMERVTRAGMAATAATAAAAAATVAGAPPPSTLRFDTALGHLDVADAAAQLREHVLPRAWAQLVAGGRGADFGLADAAREGGIASARAKRSSSLREIEASARAECAKEARRVASEYVVAGLDDDEAATAAAVFGEAYVGATPVRPTPPWVHGLLDGVARASLRFDCARLVAAAIAGAFRDWAYLRHPALREVRARERDGWSGAALALDASHDLRSAFEAAGGAEALAAWSRFDELLAPGGSGGEREGEREWKSSSGAAVEWVDVRREAAARWKGELSEAWAIEFGADALACMRPALSS